MSTDVIDIIRDLERGNRMSEKNKYTCLLAFFGCFWVMAFMISIFLSDSALEIVAVSLLASIIGIFPIRLPNQFFYSFDIIPVIYISIQYGWMYAILPAFISLLVLQYRYSPKRTFNTLRFFITLGMYVIALFAGQVFFLFLGDPDSFFKMLIFIALLDMISLLLKRGIQASILGTPLFVRPTSADLLYIFIFIVFSSIISFALYNTETGPELIREVIFAAILLFLLSVITNKYVDQMLLTEEMRVGYEMCLQAADQIFLLIDRKGIIQTVNNIAEHALGYSKTNIIGASIWQFTCENTELMQQAVNRTLEGAAESAVFRFTGRTGDIVTVQAVLLPFTQYKKVAGVYLVGRAGTSDARE